MGMTHDLSGFGLHPSGEPSAVADQGPPRGVLVDSFTRPVHVEWDREAAFTPLGQLPFLIDFLKTAGLFDAVLDESPAKGRRAAKWCRSLHPDVTAQAISAVEHYENYSRKEGRRLFESGAPEVVAVAQLIFRCWPRADRITAWSSVCNSTDQPPGRFTFPRIPCPSSFACQK